MERHHLDLDAGTGEVAAPFRTAEDPSVNQPMMVCADLDLPKGKKFENGEDWKVIEDAGYSVEDVLNVAFGGDPEKLRAEGMKVIPGVEGTRQEGHAVSIISSIDERPKHSGVNAYRERYRECVGVIASGIRASDGVRVSFMSHAPPPLFMRKDIAKDLFETQMRESFEALKQQCVEGTMDVAIIGGRPSLPGDHEFMQKVPDTYEKAIQFVSSLSLRTLAIRPLVVALPEVYGNSIEAFFNTAKNQLHVRVVGAPHAVTKAAGTYSVTRYDEAAHKIGDLL